MLFVTIADANRACRRRWATQRQRLRQPVMEITTMGVISTYLSGIPLFIRQFQLRVRRSEHLLRNRKKALELVSGNVVTKKAKQFQRRFGLPDHADTQ